jgi:hypothetical protein
MLACSIRGFAQSDLKATVGVNVSGYSSGPEGSQSSSRAGWQVGGTVTFGGNVYGEFGALYVSRSTEFTSSTSAENLTASVTGVRIPASLGVRFAAEPGNPISMHVFGGAAAFIVTTVDIKDLSKDDLAASTYGVFAGGGLDFGQFFADFSYEWSLTDASSTAKADVGKSRSLYLNVGYRISL